MKKEEHSECIAFVRYLRTLGCLFSKISNETGGVNMGKVMYQKAEGLNGGVPDYIIIVRCRSGKKKLILIEMKKRKGGVVSIKQKLWISALIEAGISASVCNGAIEAVKFTQNVISAN